MQSDQVAPIRRQQHDGERVSSDPTSRASAVDDEYHADGRAGIGALDVSSTLTVGQLQTLFITAQVEASPR